MADILSVALRAASLVLLLQAAGIALFVATFGPRLAGHGAGRTGHGAGLADCGREVRRIGRGSALLGIAVVAGHYALQAGRLAGDLSGVASSELQGIVLHSAAGPEAALRITGLLLVAAGLRASSGLATTAAVVGATLAIIAFTLTGHTSVSPERWLLIIALTIHVLVVAFWLGALPPLFLALRESGEAAADLVAAFSAVATWLVPAIFAAGAVLAVGLVPGLVTFRRPYGELLLAKIGGFAVLIALASANKWRLTPALARGDPRAAAALRRSIAAEYALIAGVLTATAIMTAFFSPD